MNQSIQVDLIEEKYDVLKEHLQKDVAAFLTKDLRALLYSFKKNGGQSRELEIELLKLVETSFVVYADIRVLVDEWSAPLFAELDITTANTCSDLLLYLYLAFEESEAFSWIEERFELEAADLLASAHPDVIFDWLLLWSLDTFPQVCKLIFKQEQLHPFRILQHFPLRQVIFYLPQFMFWGIGSCLENLTTRAIVLELIRGKSIRKLKCCPAPFTKRMAHYFTNAPKTLQFEEAVWYALVKGWNGNELIAQAFQKHFQNWTTRFDFIQVLVQFFTPYQQQLKEAELTKLLGFCQHLKDEQAPFSLKGWTLNSLRRRSKQWYQELDQRMEEQRAQWAVYCKTGIRIVANWKGADYESFEWEHANATYKIIQLNSVKALREEGQRMRHCVGNYPQRCQLHGTSIWSLRRIDEEGTKSLVTIEVSKDDRIVQAKRKHNATPSAFEWNLIQEWANQEELVCAAYLLSRGR